MIDFKVQVNDSNIKVVFDQFPKKLQANLKKAIASLTDKVLARVLAGEPHRTGQLQIETRRFVDEHENWIRGRVRILGPGGRGHNVAAAALEYGAHRSFPVRSYRRGGGRVGAYRRRANITELRFLRGAAEGIRATAAAELQRAITETITEINRTT